MENLNHCLFTMSHQTCLYFFPDFQALPGESRVHFPQHQPALPHIKNNIASFVVIGVCFLLIFENIDRFNFGLHGDFLSQNVI